jgi:hypothetical protein
MNPAQCNMDPTCITNAQMCAATHCATQQTALDMCNGTLGMMNCSGMGLNAGDRSLCFPM